MQQHWQIKQLKCPPEHLNPLSSTHGPKGRQYFLWSRIQLSTSFRLALAHSAYYTTFTSFLASYGYIIVGVDHLYDSDPVELPNGELIHDVLSDTNNTLAAEI